MKDNWLRLVLTSFGALELAPNLSPDDVERGLEQLRQAFLDLSERQQYVLTERYGLVSGQCQSYRAIGETSRVTPERIRQIEHDAFRRLRHPRYKRTFHVLVSGDQPSGPESDSVSFAEAGILSRRRFCWARLLYDCLSPQTWKTLTEIRWLAYPGGPAARNTAYSVLRKLVSCGLAEQLSDSSTALFRRTAKTWDERWPTTYFAVSDQRQEEFSGLSQRLRYALWRAGYRTRLAIAQASDDDLLRVRNFGRRSLADVRAVIPYQEKRQAPTEQVAEPELQW